MAESTILKLPRNHYQNPNVVHQIGNADFPTGSNHSAVPAVIVVPHIIDQEAKNTVVKASITAIVSTTALVMDL